MIGSLNIGRGNVSIASSRDCDNGGSSGPPLAHAMFWVKGDVQLETQVEPDTGLVVVRWRDQAGQNQDLDVTDSGKWPLAGVDTIDGIPCASFPLNNTAHANIRRAANMKDSTGATLTAAAARTVMAMVLPRTADAGGIALTGGPVFSFRTPAFAFQCLFDLESFFHPNGFYVFANNWRFGGAQVLGPDTPAATYANIPTLVEWRSSGAPALAVAINGGADLALAPAANPEAGGHNVAGFVLGNCDDLATLDQVNFYGAIAEVIAWDYDLATDAAALAQARSYFANRYPSAPVVN